MPDRPAAAGAAATVTHQPQAETQEVTFSSDGHADDHQVCQCMIYSNSQPLCASFLLTHHPIVLICHSNQNHLSYSGIGLGRRVQHVPGPS